MITLSTMQEKGGVGKTTLAVHLACAQAKRGKRVLLIDADPQGHATIGVGLEKYHGCYDFLVRNAAYADVMRPVPSERYGGTGKSTLYVIGGNVETRNIANSLGDAWTLADRLDPLSDKFDFVIIDTSPTPSLFHSVIYLASDRVIYPTLAETWSVDGLKESVFRRNRFTTMRDINIAGVVPMRVRGNTLEHSENLARLQEQYPDSLWPAVPESIIWAEAAAYGVPVYVLAPDHPASALVEDMANRLEA